MRMDMKNQGRKRLDTIHFLSIIFGTLTFTKKTVWADTNLSLDKGKTVNINKNILTIRDNTSGIAVRLTAPAGSWIRLVSY